ncbi:hypothetical protein DPMN_175566 [Dreissena polymorpha]|uniref:DNA topoisomerase I DNA binding eukaryotic-type domain-containing protein n=1 Tax=Dreissena polymorpha TaxID=45954 RepID=A0A9D4E5F6_DREPO|nr:hypothetical protein DPMN_175566 [Dreissena polymorpha]
MELCSQIGLMQTKNLGQFSFIKKKKKSKTAAKTTIPTSSPTTKKAAKEEPQEVWKWWEEEKAEGGVKWTFLEHKGPVFAPEYEPLPDEIKFYYDGMRIVSPKFGLNAYA